MCPLLFQNWFLSSIHTHFTLIQLPGMKLTQAHRKYIDSQKWYIWAYRILENPNRPPPQLSYSLTCFRFASICSDWLNLLASFENFFRLRIKHAVSSLNYNCWRLCGNFCACCSKKKENCSLILFTFLFLFIDSFL